MSLEGLNSLIQLEGARLESARQTNQNFQSVGQNIQQQGLQTSRSKNDMWLSKINAAYDQECAQATVKRLESKYVRQKKAQDLAGIITKVAFVASAANNLWNFGKDMLGDQKLGDIPKYMQTKPMNPNTAKLLYNPTQTSDVPVKDERTGEIRSVSNFDNFIVSPEQENSGNETVYFFTSDSEGKPRDVRAATVSDYDIQKAVGGKDYSEIADKVGKPGGPLSFSDVFSVKPELAKKIVQDIGHDVGRSEADNFMQSYTGAHVNNPIRVIKPTPKQETAPAGVTGASSKPEKPSDDALKIAKVSAIAKGVKPEEFEEIEKKARANDPQAIAKINEILLNNVKTQFGDTAVEIKGADGKVESKPIAQLSPQQIKDLKPENLKDNPDAGKIIAAISQITSAPQAGEGTKATAGKNNYVTLTGKTKDPEVIQVHSTKDGKPNVIQVELNDANRQKIADALGVKLEDVKGKSFEDIYKMFEANPQKGVGALDEVFTGKTASVTSTDVTNDKSKLVPLDVANEITQRNDNKAKTVNSMRDMLTNTGKLDASYADSGFDKALGGVQKGAKGLFNAIAKTAEEVVPYYQAYLKAKDAADSTREELEEAKAKLAAATKRLRGIQQQIDVFGGRSA